VAKPTAEDRLLKRKNMRQNLAATFGDAPVRKFKIPQELRKVSAEIDKKFSELEEKQRSVSASSQEYLPTDEDEIKSFITEREAVTKEAVATYMKAKEVLEDLREQGSFNVETFKKMRSVLDEAESVFALERGALAKYKARITLGISADQVHERLGEAYMMAITDRMQVPPHATIGFFGGKGSQSDQNNFRTKLIQAYNGPEAGKKSIWCPVIKDYIIGKSHVTAAHLVPLAIGETNAAYIFGVGLDEGFDCIWSQKKWSVAL